MQKNIVQLAADYTYLLFKEQMSNKLLYHNEATLFHDLGYIKVYTGHEAVSQNIAATFLKKHHYPASLITQVQALIGATHILQQPTNLLEEIIKDADLNNVGQGKYLRTISNLRTELDTFLDQQFKDIAWYKANVKFLDGHSFFTKKAKKLFSKKKKSNRKKVKKLIKSLKGGL